MSGFIKPGSLSQGHFGFKYDRSVPNKDSAPSTSGRTADRPSRARSPSKESQQASKRARPGDSLPASKHRREILYLVENHATLILLGETGSGKTTQVPQFLLEAGWAEAGRQIACTQPRRAAAASVAARVAEELGCELGQLVGYAVRFDAVETPGVTRLKYLTDGVLIREMMEDPLLTKYSVIMVDEAHERSLATDMLLGLLKKVQRRRPDLRLIISSATLQAEQLRAFFTPAMSHTPKGGEGAAHLPTCRDPAVLSIEGRTHPVEVHYLQAPTSDYVTAAVSSVVDIHKVDLPGDVLVFMTGQEEVTSAVEMLEREVERLAHSTGYGLRMLPLPLYAGLPGPQQAAAFAPAPRGVRKVVVSTNLAETSLTLPGVVYVVDCLHVKQRAYNPLLGLESLLIAPVSKASAMQRAGRAGRVRAGKCFRLCTETDYEGLPDATVPEMQRSDLTGMVLQLKALGIDNIMRFEWLAPPPAETMVRALEGLHALGVLDHDAKLTREVGMPLAEMPLEPHLGRCLLSSAAAGCSLEAATVAALLSVPHVWVGSAGAHRAQDEARAKFAAAEGDLVTLLNVWRAWGEKGRDRRWAGRHFLNQHSLLKAEEVLRQLHGLMRRLGLPLKSCEGDMELMCKSIVQGMFQNAAVFDRVQYTPLAPESDPGTNVYRLIRPLPKGQEVRLRIHPSSVLWRSRPSHLVFNSVQQTDDGWFEMQGVTAVQPEWLAEAAPHMYVRR